MKNQPQIDNSAPVSSESETASRWESNRRKGLGIIAILAVLAGFAAQKMIRSYKNTDQTEAVSTARQIGLALFEFETEYGRFPDESTIESVRRSTGTELKLGNRSSNDFFRQLIASGIASKEQMFHAKIPGARKPDGDIEGDRALEKGEVGFSYLAGQTSVGNPGRPLLVTPLIPGTDRFDRTLFNGKGVILRMGGSATSITIDSSGHALLDGRNVLDPAHPVWGGNPPRIVWPE